MKTGRNEPCPCGSGKKYKKCCLGKEAAAPTGLAQRYPSTRDLQHLPGSPRAHMPIHSLVKLTEQADLSMFEPAKRLEYEAVREASWTRAKIASLSTDAIEKQLREYGVGYQREKFVALAQQMFSAWQLAEIWYSQGGLTCRGMDEDFLGIAACELWKRLLPERPSSELVDDWLEAGYAVVNEDPCRACEAWWPAWRVLQARFSPKMRTMEATAEVFRGTYLLYNWCQDLELWLSNATLHDRKFAAWGEQYCREWLAQFSDEPPEMQVGFRRAWAEFTFRSGQVEPARLILQETLERFPKDPWSYVALADAYSHLFADLHFHLPFDLEKAREFLELGMRRLRSKRDRSVLQERLDELSESVPVTQKPPPPPPKRGSTTIDFPGILAR